MGIRAVKRIPLRPKTFKRFRCYKAQKGYRTYDKALKGLMKKRT